MNLVHLESLFTEIALRNVHMFFRSNPNWSVVEPLRNIGELLCSPRQKSRPCVVPDRSLDPHLNCLFQDGGSGSSTTS